MNYFFDYIKQRFQSDNKLKIVILISLAISLIIGGVGIKIYPNLLLNISIWLLFIFVPSMVITTLSLYLEFKNKETILNYIFINLIGLVVLFLIVSMFTTPSINMVMTILLLFLLISGTMNGIHFLIRPKNKTVAPIMLNIPMPKRGQLWALQAQDHYVNIITSKGSHLIYIKFNEALKQTGNIDGIQISRSYWVAKNGLQDIIKQSGKNICILKDGTKIPIAKNHLDNIKNKKWIK
ncbi:MAG: LytTR family DNA-binding domain-containing protein [Alphaproteobacteria bacterium]